METVSTKQLITHYLSLLRRGKYFVITPVVLALIIGSAIAFKLPPAYRSEAKIFYVQAQIPDWLQLQTVNIYLEAAIIFIEALAFSRSNTLQWINDLELYPDLIDKVPVEDIMQTIKNSYSQKAIYTSIAGTGGKTEEIITGFHISFEHQDPKKAYQVANILATEFVSLYQSFREGFASKTSSFFEDERNRLKEEIARVDQKIAEFKEKNVNYLPELFQLNYRMLENFEDKIFALEQQLRFLRGEKRNLETNLATINPLIAMEGLSGERVVTPEEKLAALKAELDVMMIQYSEKHPDIIRAKQEIRELEKLVADKQQEQEKNSSEKDQTGSASRFFKEEFSGIYNPAYVTMITEIERLQLEITTLENEKKEYEKNLIEYQMRVGRMPLVEKEYRILNRDLDSAQARYNELVNQVLTLESAAAMEKREMGAKLTVGQPPSFPLRPSKPNRPMIISASFVLGLGLGVLLLLGWDVMTQTVRTPQELLRITDVPVIVEVPTIVMEKEKKRSLSFRIKFVGPIILLVTMAIVLYLIHTFIIEVDVLCIKIFNLIRKKLLLSGL